MPGPQVESAIENARVKRTDKRGLMPLKEARALVAATEIYRKGDGEMIDGTFVLESDRVWAALLSLSDAAEFVREAQRIQWAFHVRGFDNLSLVERYGDGILPWLRSRIDRRGTLHNIPWCVLPCLLALDTREALEIALSARALDAQLPDFTQPGAFASDRHDDATEQAPANDPLEVARKWIDAHPARFPWLEELARAGNAHAAALLKDRAAAFAIPPAVRALLDAAPAIDEPPGPIWNVGALDAAAEGFDLPIWDNANYTTGAMRVTGFASREGDTLVVQTITYNPRGNEPVNRDVHAYGPGAKRPSSNKLLVPHSDMEPIWLDGINRVAANNVLHVWGEHDAEGQPIKDSRGTRLIPSAFPPDYFVVALNGEDVPVSLHIPDILGPVDKRLKELHLLTPEEGLLLEVCTHHRDQLFLGETALKKAVGAPPGAVKLFELDDFQWPLAGEKSTLDLFTMVEALKARRQITRLPGEPNSHPRHFLLPLATLRFYAGGNAWPPGDFPIAPPRPAHGPGRTPYQNLLFERGWPHGVQLLHGGMHEEMANVRVTLEYLLNAGAPLMHVYWGRRVATAWVRAIGLAERSLTLADEGVQRALADERPLYGGEARALLAGFASTKANLPAWLGADLALLLEVLIGGAETVLAFADVLAEGTHEAMAAAAFELGFVLRRIPEKPFRIKSDRQRAPILDRKKVRAALTAVKAEGEVARMLELALGKTNRARTELEWAHGKEPRAGILAAEPSPFDAWLVTLAGDDYLRKVGPRLVEEADSWTVTQLAALSSPLAAEHLETLRRARPDLATALETAGI